MDPSAHFISASRGAAGRRGSGRARGQRQIALPIVGLDAHENRLLAVRLGGVEELITARQYPLAVLVFFASILVPMLKLFGISLMLITIQTGRAGWLRDRTRLYHIVRFIGRWSMIDIFMESLLGALVAFGSVITIEPGMGALAFCAVVILTMFAAETFDPRLMWDAAPGANAWRIAPPLATPVA